MKQRTTHVLALVALAAVWVAGFVMTRAPALSDPEAAWLQTLTRSEAFRTATRDRQPDGCLALPYQEPETIVFGSSHAYAAADTAILTRELGQEVGVCGLSTFNPDMLPAFIDMLDREGLRPNRLVWMVDGGTFSLFASSDRRLDYARSALSGEMNEPVQAWLERWPEDVTDERELTRQAKAYRAATAAQAGQIADLDPAFIDGRVRRKADIFYSAMDRVIEGRQDHPRAETLVSRFCDAVAERDIELVLVVSPVPTPSRQRHPGVSNIDPREIGSRVRCARDVIDSPLPEWGLDIRHYIDRKSVAGYDYSLWSPETSDDAFDAHLDGLDRRARLRLYDTDHLNAVGSELFSRALAGELMALSDGGNGLQSRS